MGSVRSKYWALILVLLQIQLVKVQGINHTSQNLRRLSEQFQQFQALTQARLNTLALNQNRNSSRGLERRVQTLNDYYHHMSQDVEHIKQSTTQEMDGLREWSRRLERKNKRLENRLSLVERNLRENHCHAHLQKPEPCQDLLNLTLEFQSQEERLAALQVQRDELLVGLKGLQDSLKNQVQRVKQLEGRLGEVLQWNGGNIRGSGRGVELVRSTAAPQEEPRRRTEPHRGEQPGRILGGRTQHGLEGVRHRRFDSHTDKSQRNPSTHQPTHPKARKPRPPPDSHQQHPTLKPQFTDSVPQPHRPPSQTRPYPIQQKQHQTRKTVNNQ